MPAKELSIQLEAVLGVYLMLVHSLKKYILNADIIHWATTKLFGILLYCFRPSTSYKITQTLHVVGAGHR